MWLGRMSWQRTALSTHLALFNKTFWGNQTALSKRECSLQKVPQTPLGEMTLGRKPWCHLDSHRGYQRLEPSGRMNDARMRVHSSPPGSQPPQPNLTWYTGYNLTPRTGSTMAHSCQHNINPRKMNSSSERKGVEKLAHTEVANTGPSTDHAPRVSPTDGSEKAVGEGEAALH